MSNSNGKSEIAGSSYKRTEFDAGTILPDAPEGGWDTTCVRGKTKVKPTKNGDPMVLFTFRLDKADRDENEYAQGTMLTKMIILASDKSKLPAFAKRNTKLELRSLATQAGFDLGIIPNPVVESDSDTQEDVEARLRPFIDAVEGGEFQLWTTHRPDNRNPGQMQVDIKFTKPGSAFGGGGGLTSREDDEE